MKPLGLLSTMQSCDLVMQKDWPAKRLQPTSIGTHCTRHSPTMSSYLALFLLEASSIRSFQGTVSCFDVSDIRTMSCLSVVTAMVHKLFTQVDFQRPIPWSDEEPVRHPGLNLWFLPCLDKCNSLSCWALLFGLADPCPDGIGYCLQDRVVTPAIASLSHSLRATAEDVFELSSSLTQEANPQQYRLVVLGRMLYTDWIKSLIPSGSAFHSLGQEIFLSKACSHLVHALCCWIATILLEGTYFTPANTSCWTKSRLSLPLALSQQVHGVLLSPAHPTATDPTRTLCSSCDSAWSTASCSLHFLLVLTSMMALETLVSESLSRVYLKCI